jgi:hypothetical protein
VPAESEINAGDAYPLPRLAGDYTQAKAVNHSPFGPELPGVTTEREDDLEYLMAFVGQTAISGGALLLHVAGRHM